MLRRSPRPVLTPWVCGGAESSPHPASAGRDPCGKGPRRVPKAGPAVSDPDLGGRILRIGRTGAAKQAPGARHGRQHEAARACGSVQESGVEEIERNGGGRVGDEPVKVAAGKTRACCVLDGLEVVADEDLGDEGGRGSAVRLGPIGRAAAGGAGGGHGKAVATPGHGAGGRCRQEGGGARGGKAHEERHGTGQQLGDPAHHWTNSSRATSRRQIRGPRGRISG